MKERLLDLASGALAIADAALLGVLIGISDARFHHHPLALTLAAVFGAFNAVAVAKLLR
jgi:hypothetical protein